MAVERSFLVKLLADPKELFKAFQQIQDKAKDSLGEADKEALKLSASFNKIALASTAAFAGTAALITKATKAAIEDEAEQAKLAKTLSTVAGATRETVAQTEAFIAAQMKSTTFTDSEMRPALDILVRSSGNLVEAQKQMQLAMDISTQTGVPLIEVSQGLARANNDNFKSLKALSPALADNIKEGQSLEQIFAELTQTFGNSAKAAGQTTAGQMQILQNTIGETTEAIGAAFVPVLQALLGPLQAFADLAQRNAGLIAAIAAAVLTFTGIMVGLSVAIKAYTIAQTIATIATQRFGIAMSATGVGAVIIGITALVALLVTLRIRMAGVSKEVDELGQRTSQTAQFFNNFNGVSSVAGQRVIFLTNKTLVLNSALSTSSNLIATQVNRLEGLARSYGVSTFTVGKFNAENMKTGSGVSPLEKLKEAKDKVRQATKALADVQRQEFLSTEAVTEANNNFIKASDKVKAAQDKLAAAIRGYGKDSAQGREATARLEEKQRDLASALRDQTSATDNVAKAQKQLQASSQRVTTAQAALAQAIKGYGRDSKEGAAAARTLASAQRDLQRANNQVTDALKRVSDAETKLAELRAKKADPNEVVDAEFSLEKARFDVEEATLGVAEAEQKLADAMADSESTSLDIRKAELDLVQAKFRLRDAIRDVGAEESNLEKVRSTGATAEEIAEAERELEDAKLSVQDALDRQRESQDELARATDEYRQIVDGVREGDAKYVELTAEVLKAEDDRQASLKDLENANLAVEDAQIRVKKAQDDLLKEKENYRKVVDGLMDTDQEYIDLSADVVEATDDQTRAAKNLRDAQYDAAKATDAVREAEEQLRLSRKEQRVAASGVPGRAFGGPVAGGRPYMVGERGPELFVPTSSGTIIPNNRVGGGGVVVNVTVNAGMGTSGSQVGQEIVDVLRQYTRVSGPLSQYVTV